MARAKTRTLAEINAQIDRLKEEANALRTAEVAEVVGRIKQAIAHYGLTVEDLGFAPRRGRKRGGKAEAPAATVPTKYANRITSVRPVGTIKYDDGAGHTWTGRGRRPQWYIDALKAGKSSEDLAIRSAAA